MEQILTKRAIPDALLQILVRRGDHAHMGFDGSMSTDTVELPIRQHAQQPRLQVERHVADFIEEQRSPFGLLKPSAPLRLRTGEGSAFMAKQLGFQQILGDGCRIDGDERPLRAR